MKKILSLLTIGLLSSTNIFNSKAIIDTNNFISQFNSQFNSANKKSHNFLFTNDNNEFLPKEYANCNNNFELKNYNSVLLKSIAYDQKKLKLTSTLTNLINYDFKHHVSKTDTYLDKVDYLKMNSIISKNKKETLIGDNLAFLNHFFNDQSLIFNPNGYIASRRSLLTTNKLSNQQQSVFIAKNSKNSFFNNNYGLNQAGENLKLSISWSGIYFTTDHKILTHYILNILNGSASYINSITKLYKRVTGHHSLLSNGNNYFWDSWDNEKLYQYLVEEETAAQSEGNAATYAALKTSLDNPEAIEELDAFKDRINGLIDDLSIEKPYLIPRYAKLIDQQYKALTRYAKENLGYDSKASTSKRFDPNWKDDSEKVGDADLAESEADLNAADQEVLVDGTNLIEEFTLIDGEEAGEALAAAADVPILRWVVAIVVAIITIIAIVVIPIELTKIHNWKMKISPFHPSGPWTLKQIWFNRKTRLFRRLNSTQIQFTAHCYKPWIGKIQSKIVATRPLKMYPKYIAHKIKISPNLHKTYNLITGTNNNFNFVVNPTTLKQLIASSYLPNPQYSVKQVLALNKLNYNNLNLSNDTWIKLIKEIKHPYVNFKYAAILNYQNQKLTYSNIKQNQTTNFVYNQSNYLQEILVGNNNQENLLLNSRQLTKLLNDLENVKNEWNDRLKNQPKLTIHGIKNSSYYNPDHYTNYVAWYYYHFLKPDIWVDSNSVDATNIKFLTRIFKKLRLNATKLTMKQSLALMNNNSIINLSSKQF